MTGSDFISFPHDFLWGAATSSFQIEGSPLADGAAPSDWYEWTLRPGKIANGDSAEKACDHYHRFKIDVALMKKMGLKSYRFSISWPRVIPERGKVNEKALDFYRALMEELLSAGITPFATLYHWETPIWAKGGWENRETAVAFGEYAQVIFQKLGLLSPYWVTLNEPSVVAGLGYLQGLFPPGKSDKRIYGQVVHHLNLAHGLALRAFRQAKLRGEIGIALTLGTFDPVSQKEEDLRHAELMEAVNNRAFLGPLCGQGYPARFFDFTSRWEGPLEQDLELIRQPVDFIGVNHYFRNNCGYKKGADIYDNEGFVPPGSPVSDMDWEVRPQSFGDILSYVWKEFGFKKIYVTENGMATRRSQRMDHEFFQDDVRIHYLGTYLEEARKAMAAGVPLKGYFVWSLLDNFEWVQGYDPAFGIVAVDFKTQERILKKSAHWYKGVIANGGFSLSALPQNPPYRRMAAVKTR